MADQKNQQTALGDAERVNAGPLIWLDDAATRQKPRQVIDRISRFYAHQEGSEVSVDREQSVSYTKVVIRAWDTDWFIFLGQKVFGPTGIGVVYGKEALQNEIQSWQGGDNMIFDATRFGIKSTVRPSLTFYNKYLRRDRHNRANPSQIEKII